MFWSMKDSGEVLTLNVMTSGRNCNTIFDVPTSKLPNADRSEHAFYVWGILI